MPVAAYGKHPAKGDFLEVAVPAGIKTLMEQWLDAVLAEARLALGPAWERVWAGAPCLRFWLGEGIWGLPVCGVMAASQDRVGRRFPLVILACGDEAAGIAPPVIDAAQDWHSTVEAHLRAVLARPDLPAPAALVETLRLPPMGGEGAAQPSDFWAVRPGADVADLWADLALHDHRRAASARSYWWVAGNPAGDGDFQADPAPTDTAPTDTAPVGQDPAPPDSGAQDDAGEGAPAAEGGTADADAADGPVMDAPGEQVAEPAAETAALTLAAGSDGGQGDAWHVTLPLAGEEDDGASPFDSAPSIGLFAPPEAPRPEPEMPQAPMAVAPVAVPSAPRVLWTQAWAGSGLPSGEVLAWFLRGYDGNV